MLLLLPTRACLHIKLCTFVLTMIFGTTIPVYPSTFVFTLVSQQPFHYMMLYSPRGWVLHEPYPQHGSNDATVRKWRPTHST